MISENLYEYFDGLIIASGVIGADIDTCGSALIVSDGLNDRTQEIFVLLSADEWIELGQAMIAQGNRMKRAAAC